MFSQIDTIVDYKWGFLNLFDLSISSTLVPVVCTKLDLSMVYVSKSTCCTEILDILDNNDSDQNHDNWSHGECERSTLVESLFRARSKYLCSVCSLMKGNFVDKSEANCRSIARKLPWSGPLPVPVWFRTCIAGWYGFYEVQTCLLAQYCAKLLLHITIVQDKYHDHFDQRRSCNSCWKFPFVAHLSWGWNLEYCGRGGRISNVGGCISGCYTM